MYEMQTWACLMSFVQHVECIKISVIFGIMYWIIEAGVYTHSM